MIQKDPVHRDEDAHAQPAAPSAEGAGDSLLDQCLEETRASRTQPARPLQKPIGFHPREISALINAEVVARHADDAPFLWLQRDRAVTAPHYSLNDLAKLDERVEAHIDGLRVAGDYGWRLAERALTFEEPGEVFTAGILALECRIPERVGRILDIACKEPELQRGLVSAAGWTAFEPIRPVLQSWLASDSAALRRMGVAAHAVHRQDPGPPLLHLLHDDNPSVRARAFEAAAELGRTDLRSMALHARSDKDPISRICAARAAARLGDRSAETLGILREATVTPGPHQERALALAIRCLPLPEAVDWVRHLWKDPGRLRLAALGAGAAGDPALAGVLIEWMGIEAVARVAGEAFSTITGADLAYLDLDQDPPERPHGEDADEFEVLDADEDLPYPAPEKVAAWWRANRDRFEPGRRYLCGSEIDPANLRRVLVQGKQRQRAAAALELALLQPSEPLFEVRARGQLQERRLLAWTS